MKNDILFARCIDMTVEAYGVCKVDGLVIFAKGMIIDEEGYIKIIAHKKNLAYAIIDRLTKVSPFRTKEACPIAYKCGGCDLRHIVYEYQLLLKQKWLKETLTNIGGIDYDVPSIVPSPLQDRYRNKVQVPIRDHKVGFYRVNSHDIVEYTDCLIQSEKANAIIGFIKRKIIKDGTDRYFRHILIKEGFASKEIMVGLILNVEDFSGLDTLVSDIVKQFPEVMSLIVNVNTRNDNVILGDKEIVVYGSSYIIDELDGLKFKISLKSFYQTNPLQTVNLYKEVVRVSEVSKNTKVLDLYSGIGTIALFLARYAKEVIGVEVVAAAYANAIDNAQLNKIDNVKFYHDDASRSMITYLKDVDVVVVDPPRKGLNQALIKDIAESGVEKVVYVSCNPSTLARDLDRFKNLGYTLESLRGFDMFPHTTHVETIVLLQRETL